MSSGPVLLQYPSAYVSDPLLVCEYSPKVRVQAVMSFGMVLGIGSEDRRLEQGASSLPARAGNDRDGSCAPLGFREDFLSRSNAIIGGLGKCFEDGTVLGEILQELPIILSLPQDFQFSDALCYDPNQVSGGSSPIDVLKSEISKRINRIANNADSLCDSPEKKAQYMNRLESQFNTVLTKLIEAERSGCETKVQRFCDLVDSVLELAQGDPLCVLGERLDELKRFTTSLRNYASCYLETNAKAPSSIELLSTGPGVSSVATPLKEFFDQLNSVTVELISSLSEQNAP